MIQVLEYIIKILTTDSTLNAIVPAAQIFTGPVDVATEKQVELLLPQLNIHLISEAQRTVPKNVRDTIIQIDIWSRNDMLEVLTIYERIITLLEYTIANKNTAHIFWDRVSSVVDQYESDRRIFHRSVSFTFWDMNGQ